MDIQAYKQQIAYLEFSNDQLQAELFYIDSLLKNIGFSQGLLTIKSAAEEIITEMSIADNTKDTKNDFEL